MRDQTVQFEFLPKDKVSVPDLDISGIVTALFVDVDMTIHYQVEYVDKNGTVDSRYFTSDRLVVKN